MNPSNARWKSFLKYFLWVVIICKIRTLSENKINLKRKHKKCMHKAWNSSVASCRNKINDNTRKNEPTFSLFSFVCCKQLPNRVINRWDYNDLYRTPFILCISLQNIQWFGISVRMVLMTNSREEKVEKKSNWNDDNEGDDEIKIGTVKQ